jgi:hypothetical protein
LNRAILLSQFRVNRELLLKSLSGLTEGTVINSTNQFPDFGLRYSSEAIEKLHQHCPSHRLPAAPQSITATSLAA